MRVVFDASTVVGAALRADGIPRRALLLARERHVIALSTAIFAEIDEVLQRPKFSRIVTDEVRQEILWLLSAAAVWVQPDVRITDCRDPNDDAYLELAAAADAGLIISSDQDLLTLDPWRGIRVLPPRAFLAMEGEEPA